QYYNTGPSVFGPVGRIVVRHQWNVAAPSGGGHTLGIYTVIVLKDSYNGSSTFNAQIPIVQQHSFSVGYVIGMAFYHKFKIGFVVDHLGHFAQYFLSTACNIVTATAKQ